MSNKAAVLFLDDDLGVLENLSDLLRLSGYEVISCAQLQYGYLDRPL
jgi:DNA-binding NtrC family response regulator